MRFGSVCSGIEAASVAWTPLGWRAAWLSEIESFPSAVLKHHYPEVPNFGDMTTLPERIRSGEVEAPDVFCGGTPCQAFSVAGLRRSLNDARGNLSLTFCEIADAIDHIRCARGAEPTIIFWENVPGVLSTKDNAFGCFLAGLAGEDQPLVPAGNKWTNAGVVFGPKRAIAWRVLDAQYFGLAQRRRRVFVVASARDGFDPAKILFEQQGVRRESAPSRATGQRAAPTISSGPPFGRTGNDRVEAEAMVVQPYAVANCPTQRMHKGINSTLDEGQTPVLQPVTYDFFNITAPVNRQNRNPGDPCHTLARSNAEHAVVMGAVASHNRQDPDVSGSITHPLGAKDNGLGVMQPIAIQDCRGVEKAQNGLGWNDDGVAYTVDTHATQGVCLGGQHPNAAVCVDQSPTLTNAMGAGGGHVPVLAHVVAPSLTASNDPSRSPQSSEVTQQVAAVVKATTAVMQPIGLDEEQNAMVNAFGTLKARTAGGGFEGSVMQTNMQVRRLTVEECEFLQGFPRSYTAIPWRGKPASECPDGPRYKALGNSWAVPVVRWIGRRINMVDLGLL